jgi:hypothetical protein
MDRGGMMDKLQDKSSVSVLWFDMSSIGLHTTIHEP